MLPVAEVLPDAIVTDIVSELPGGRIILPSILRMTGPIASSIDINVAGEPVGAAVAVRAVLTLVTALPKL